LRELLAGSVLALLACAPVALAAAPDRVAAELPENEDPVFSGSQDAGTGTAAFRLGFYHNQDDDDGNPFLDEELTVVEPILIVNYNLSDRLAAWSQLSYDYVSSASIDRLSNFSNQSGASGDNYYGIDLGARYELSEDRRIGGHLGGSTEYDYRSISFGGDFSQDLANKDATLKLAVNGFADFIDVIRFDGEEESGDERYSLAATLDWYQVLDAKTHGELGSTFAFQEGFLETPYNAVVIEDAALPPNPQLDNRARGREITEELPNTRTRGAIFGRARRFVVPGTALELGGRLYGDSWDVYSVAVQPRLYQVLIPDALDLRIGYRYYTQTAAQHYERHFRGRERHRTQDSDLSSFDSHGVDLKLTWRSWDTFEMDLTGGYTFRDDGIDQVLASFGITKEFDLRGTLEKLWRW
jgi:hypothetical protein